MTEFVRIVPIGPATPGERLRLEFVDGDILLCSESVHDEQILNPEARHYVTRDLIELDTALLRWLHRVTGELIAEIDRDAAPHPVDDKFDHGGSHE